MLTPKEREEITAVRDSDGRGLPIEAVRASQRYLAKLCLELDDEIRFVAAPPEPESMPTLDQLLPDRHKPKLLPPEERPERRRGHPGEAVMDSPMDSTPYDEATMDPTVVGYPPPPKPLTADPRDLP